MPKPQLRFRIPKAIIEAGNVSRVAALLGPALIPPDQLASRCNTLSVELDYTTGERGELYTLPKVRSFLRRLHKAWPDSAYFCSLRTDFLLTHTLCQLDHLLTVEFKAHNMAAVRFEPGELRQLLLQGRDSIKTLGTRAGLSRRQITGRKNAFCRYFAKRLQLPAPLKDFLGSNGNS